MYYVVLYLQNGDRIVTIDSVTSLHPMYSGVVPFGAVLEACAQVSCVVRIFDSCKEEEEVDP